MSSQMRIPFIITAVLLFSPVNAEQFKIPWKGDYAHNSSQTSDAHADVGAVGL
jgi:uncharacterized membrane protein